MASAFPLACRSPSTFRPSPSAACHPSKSRSAPHPPLASAMRSAAKIPFVVKARRNPTHFKFPAHPPTLHARSQQQSTATRLQKSATKLSRGNLDLPDSRCAWIYCKSQNFLGPKQRAKGVEPSTFTLATGPDPSLNSQQIQSVTECSPQADSASMSAPQAHAVVTRLTPEMHLVLGNWASLPRYFQDLILLTAQSVLPIAGGGSGGVSK